MNERLYTLNQIKGKLEAARNSGGVVTRNVSTPSGIVKETIDVIETEDAISMIGQLVETVEALIDPSSATAELERLVAENNAQAAEATIDGAEAETVSGGAPEADAEVTEGEVTEDSATGAADESNDTAASEEVSETNG